MPTRRCSPHNDCWSNRSGGTYHQVVGDDISATLIAFAHAENVTQLVLGASRRSRLGALLNGGVGIGSTTTRMSGDLDVHTVMHDQAGRRHVGPSLPRGLTARRRLAGAVLGAVLLPLLTLVLGNTRSNFNLSSDLLAYLVAVVAVALVGGLYAALATAVVSSLLINYYFTPPLYKWTIAEHNNIVAIAAFVIVAATVSFVVELAARRTSQAARASAESETLATLAGSVLRGQTGVSALLEQVRETLQLTSVSLLERDSAGDSAERPWAVVESVGVQPCTTPAEADTEVPVGDRFALAVRGRPLAASDLRVLGAFAAQAVTAVEQQRLTAVAEAARPLEEADRMRTALLNAVSHDLRTPLASAKAAVTGLRSADVAWTDSERAELLATADESLDRLHRLVDNLLDMSRIQAGALSIQRQSVALHETVPIALDSLGPAARDIELDIPDSLPEVETDPALLERVIANLTANALRYSPPGTPPRVSASTHADSVELRISDRGPGISELQRERMFTPFQRLGDTDNTTGVGLGLALSLGLMQALGHTLTPEETPGGGLTMVLGDADQQGTKRRSGAHGHHCAACSGRSRRTRGRRSAGRSPAVTAMPAMTRVLVVDDEPQILRALSITLRARSYDVVVATNGKQALAAAAASSPDIVVLDLGLPDLDGLDVIRGLRGWSKVPIVVLSGRSQGVSKVDALDAGADDYVTKPFNVDELLARLRAVTRRAPTGSDEVRAVIGDVKVELPGRRISARVSSSGAPDIRLTPTEWQLLEVLIRNPGRLVTQREMLRSIDRADIGDQSHYLRQFMNQLRRKLEPDPARPRYLMTESGMGYRFQP